MSNLTHITLSTDLINAILGYLGKQPYVEVTSLIQGIQQEAQQQGQPEPSPDEIAADIEADDIRRRRKAEARAMSQDEIKRLNAEAQRQANLDRIARKRLAKHPTEARRELEQVQASDLGPCRS